MSGSVERDGRIGLGRCYYGPWPNYVGEFKFRSFGYAIDTQDQSFGH